MPDTTTHPTRGKDDTLPLFCFGALPGVLRAEGVTVRFGELLALDEVNLVVAPGSHVALVGPNGSGKTTLLLALKGVLSPTAGRVSLGAKDLDGIDPRVGLVFANPEDQGVSPIVEDDVAFGLENLGLPPLEIRARVHSILRGMGLFDLRARPVHTLSGGQAQKLALGAVLALGARYLLLDEATSMLSPWDRDRFMSILVRLRTQGAGILQVTHQAEELLWADRVVCLEAGRVTFEGSPSAFFDRPNSRWQRPVYAEMTRHLSRAGAESPSYSEWVRWLERGE